MRPSDRAVAGFTRRTLADVQNDRLRQIRWRRLPHGQPHERGVNGAITRRIAARADQRDLLRGPAGLDPELDSQSIEARTRLFASAKRIDDAVLKRCDKAGMSCARHERSRTADRRPHDDECIDVRSFGDKSGAGEQLRQRRIGGELTFDLSAHNTRSQRIFIKDLRAARPDERIQRRIKRLRANVERTRLGDISSSKRRDRIKGKQGQRQQRVGSLVGEAVDGLSHENKDFHKTEGQGGALI
jgi:hypothetical protein